MDILDELELNHLAHCCLDVVGFTLGLSHKVAIPVKTSVSGKQCKSNRPLSDVWDLQSRVQGWQKATNLYNRKPEMQVGRGRAKLFLPA